MLPSHARDAYEGDKKRRRGSHGKQQIVIVVLALITVVAACGSVFSRREWHTLQSSLASLRNELVHAEGDLRRSQDAFRGMEGQYHALNRDFISRTRQLAAMEQDLSYERRQREISSKECQDLQKEAGEKLEYERGVNDALKKHVLALEEAHRNRERDWHTLSEKWRSYEEDTIKENHRLLTENQKLQNLEVQMKFNDPVMPLEEPENRAEATIDANFHLPEYHRGEHYKRVAAEMDLQQRRLSEHLADQQQRQQQQQVQQEAQPASHQHHNTHYPQHHDDLAGMHQQPPAHPSNMRHHDDIYSHHDEDLDWARNTWNDPSHPDNWREHGSLHLGTNDHHGHHWQDSPPAHSGHKSNEHWPEQQQQPPSAKRWDWNRQAAGVRTPPVQGHEQWQQGQGHAPSHPGSVPGWHSGSHEHGHHQPQHHDSPPHGGHGGHPSHDHDWQAQQAQQHQQHQQYHGHETPQEGRDPGRRSLDDLNYKLGF